MDATSPRRGSDEPSRCPSAAIPHTHRCWLWVNGHQDELIVTTAVDDAKRWP